MLKSLTKTVAVVVSATILTTLAVNAIDTGGSVATSLTAMIGGTTEETGPCSTNMVLIDHALVPYCVDMYEASPGEYCLYNDPQSADESDLNLIDPTCIPVSQPQTSPWRYVSQEQASRACERADKRLLTPSEWYKAAVGTPDDMALLGDEQCNIASNRSASVAKTGSGMRCVSDAGTYDMVGNVWEWVTGESVKGVWEEKTLPGNGYVRNVDVDGVPVETGTRQDERFNGDRFWMDAGITAGLMRGGYYNSKENAGVYTVYAASPPSFVGEAVGFRCASDPRS
jgi:formylglycine-generating enzyme required for sulfatase activity